VPAQCFQKYGKYASKKFRSDAIIKWGDSIEMESKKKPLHQELLRYVMLSSRR
jgi:hypothetical protein